jgi:probable rRNA maturation factor
MPRSQGGRTAVARIRSGTLVPSEDGLRIEELVGLSQTNTRSFSVTRMRAPALWRQPALERRQDEALWVLQGTLTLLQGRRRERLGKGELGLVPSGTPVALRNDDPVLPCEYLSVCAPARRGPRTAQDASPAPKDAPVVDVRASVARGRPHAERLLLEARHFLHLLGIRGVELSVLLVGDGQMRKLNQRWRGKDTATDVLSFPAGPLPRGLPGPRPLGDVILSVDTAARVARSLGRPVEAELARYLAHGILHLLGYDHEAGPRQARKMATLEAKLLGDPGLIPEGR